MRLMPLLNNGRKSEKLKGLIVRLYETNFYKYKNKYYTIGSSIHFVGNKFATL